MSSVVANVPSQSDSPPPTRPQLRHGLIPPPAEVRLRLEQERAKHPADLFARHEEQLLNDWTIGYVCDGMCQEVIYRRTPAGPEVIAIGMDEVVAWNKSTPLAEQMHFETYLGY